MAAPHNVSNLSWQPQGTNGQNRVAFVAVDTSIATLWNISNTGTGAGSDTAQNIVPQWLLIDNIKNNTLVTITMGQVTLTVPAFQRESFPISPGMRTFTIEAFAGVINVYLSEDRLAGDLDNALLVQQTSVKTLIYAFSTYTANQAQLATDLNTSILFKAAANVTYSLLGIAANIGNGWLQFIYNDNADGVLLTIDAAGADLIWCNGYNSGTLVLFPGESCILASNGQEWYADKFSFGNAVLFTTANALQSAADNNRARVFAGGAITYTLLPAISIENGFTQPLINAGGSPVTIQTTGNSLYYEGNAVTSLIIQPGGSGIIYTDGSVWYFLGKRNPRQEFNFTTANDNMTDKDANASRLFNASTPITYTLLSVSAVFPDFFQPIGVLQSTVTLQAQAGQTIFYPQGASGNSIVLPVGFTGFLIPNGGTSWTLYGSSPFVASGNPLVKSVTASATQNAADAECNLYFNSGSALTYTLLSAGTLGNPFRQKLHNVNAGAVSVVPAGGSTIFSSVARTYNAANPLILSENDSGELYTDGGGNWFWRGTNSFESPEQAVAVSTAYSVAHGLRSIPDITNVVARCKTASEGFAVGDEIQMNGVTPFGAAGNPAAFSPWSSPTAVGFTTGTSLPLIANKGTGVLSPFTAANWRFVVKAQVFSD